MHRMRQFEFYTIHRGNIENMQELKSWKKKKRHWEPHHEQKQKPIEGAGVMESCCWLKNKIKDKAWGKARISDFP